MMRFVNKVYFILTSITLIASLSNANSLQCSDLFQEEPAHPTAISMAKALVDKIPWKEWNVRVEEARASIADLNGLVEVVRNAIFDIELNDGFHRNSAVYYSKKQSSEMTNLIPSATTTKFANDLFYKTRMKAMKFVIESYRKRRPHWPANFHEKLMKLSKEYEKESTYIMVENKPWETDGTTPRNKLMELIGTIRLIHEKNGRVPMEDYLNIKVKTNKNQMKVEPGNFAMAHEGNEIASIEFAIQLIAQMKRYRTEFGKEALFVTYADSYSERLYGGMGFKYLNGAHLENAPREAFVDGAYRINKDDVDWAPMYATEEMLTTHLKSRLERAADKRDDEELLKQLNSALAVTEKKVSQTPEVFVGLGNDQAIQISKPEARLYISRNGDRASLYLQPGYEYSRRVFRAGHWATAHLPLHEGWSGQVSTDVAGRYQNGIFEITQRVVIPGQPIETIKYELKIDSMLTNPIWIRVFHISGDTIFNDGRYQF